MKSLEQSEKFSMQYDEYVAACDMFQALRVQIIEYLRDKPISSGIPATGDSQFNMMRLGEVDAFYSIQSFPIRVIEERPGRNRLCCSDMSVRLSIPESCLVDKSLISLVQLSANGHYLALGGFRRVLPRNETSFESRNTNNCRIVPDCYKIWDIDLSGGLYGR